MYIVTRYNEEEHVEGCVFQVTEMPQDEKNGLHNSRPCPREDIEQLYHRKKLQKTVQTTAPHTILNKKVKHTRTHTHLHTCPDTCPHTHTHTRAPIQTCTDTNTHNSKV